MATFILSHPEGEVHIAELAGDRRQVSVRCFDPARFVPIRSCETRYSRELIALTLDVSGLAWLCDAILRDEDPHYVREEIWVNLFAYLPAARFEGKRLLDFGCGAGASTVCIGQLLPHTEVLGVELDGRLIALGEARARHYGLSNVGFRMSPSGTELPPEAGEFDFCMMSAVYEHLLPAERRAVLPLIWSRLRPGGVLFINQTPHRFYPLETHSTRLPLINYLPDRLAFAAARRYARVSTPLGQTDQQLLRGGLRGATEREILGHIRRAGAGRPILLEPEQAGCRDRVDLWYSQLNPHRLRAVKGMLRYALKMVYGLTGSVFTQNLTLAIQKSLVAVSARVPRGTAPSPTGDISVSA